MATIEENRERLRQLEEEMNAVLAQIDVMENGEENPLEGKEIINVFLFPSFVADYQVQTCLRLVDYPNMAEFHIIVKSKAKQIIYKLILRD